MRLKEESEKAGLKFSIQKTKIMASGPITSWQICVCWVMSDSVTPWTVALQAPLSMGFPGKDCWTAVSYSRGSFWPKDWTHVSYILCIDRRILYQLGYLGSQIEGGKVKDFIFLGSKITAMITAVMKLKDTCSLEGEFWQRASLVAQLVKTLPAMQETCIQSLGQEDPLEKEMATHSSIVDCRIPWTEEPGRLQSMGLQESDVT